MTEVKTFIRKKDMKIWELGIVLFSLWAIALLSIDLANAYQINNDRSLDANCLNYSYEVRDELISQRFDARIVGFGAKGKLGHAMVIINYGTVNWVIIESYTGQEFRINDNFEEYLIGVLGYYPEWIWIAPNKIYL